VSARRSQPLKGTALFVHGLWVNGTESFALRRRLAARGWALRVFPWSSLGETMDGVAARCARQALALARQTSQPVHLIGHSLGGNVVYHVFETGMLEPDRFSGDFCRVVFMGTPVCGSRSARALAKVAFGRRMLGRAGADDLLQGLPTRWCFPAQLGVIAGTRAYGLGRLITRFEGPNDGTIAVDETRIEGAADTCELPVSHVGMAFSAEVANQVASFLESGRFTVNAQDRSR
jgi:pimeloyl-ACP methyl ester carboxylesterase